ncbi:hypothetical protein NLI96_g12898 [Meripilus lineatus]|uniref:Reverse transcriptase Ty1/copia-type domain-containing protein n=1 Tax=Meripilus lineatus TaxID=2056292 RepID=A0AAD5UNZ1_9APHY|nr:hypothetical protein NLI96_g12898 [Physisporinus lineatus]
MPPSTTDPADAIKPATAAIKEPSTPATILPVPPTPATIFHTPKSSPATPAINRPSFIPVPSKSASKPAPAPAPIPRPSRTTAPRINYKHYGKTGQRVPGPAPEANLCFLAELGHDAPQTLAEAQARSDWPEWESAMKAEMSQLHQLHTYSLEDLPSDRKAVGCRWVFAVKRDADGKIIKYKARLVAQGFSQIPGQDFSATFAPVMRLESFRALLAIAAVLDWEIHQMDVVGAYLNSDLDESIFMKQPPGFSDGTSRVCHLFKAIYGLKQAGRAWNIKFNRIFVETLSYTRIHPDYCVYIKTFTDSDLVIVIIHVDDMALLGTTITIINRAKDEIRPHLNVTDLGEIQTFVGLKITRDRSAHTLTISQPHYIDVVLQRFNMEASHPVSTPLDPTSKLEPTPSDFDQSSMTNIPYQAAIGSLMYAAVATRPDISFAVQALSQFNTNPSPVHWTAVKHVLRYLNGTRTLGITYGNGTLDLIGYTDADWAQSTADRRSVSGYTFLLSGGAISWSSKKQPTVALSTMEAEYLALAHATKEAIWLRSLLDNLHFPIDHATPINCDNQSAIAFAHDHQFHARSKHIDIRHHFIRQHISDKEIVVPHVATQDNVADVLTKALPRDAHTRHSQSLGLSAH